MLLHGSWSIRSKFDSYQPIRPNFLSIRSNFFNQFVPTFFDQFVPTFLYQFVPNPIRSNFYLKMTSQTGAPAERSVP